MLKWYISCVNTFGPVGNRTLPFGAGTVRRPPLRLRNDMLLFMAAAMTLTACGPEVQVPTWNRVDVPSLIQRLDNPSGSIASVVASAALLAQLAVETEALASVSRTVDSLQPPSPATEPTTAGSGGRGTVAFVEFACPGTNIEQRATDFSFGWIRIDAPGLDIAKIVSGAPSFRGDVLLSFENCRRGDTKLDGSAAVFLEPERFGFSTQIDLTSGEPATVSTLVADGLLESRELRFNSNTLGQLTVATNLDNLNVVKIIGQDGQLTCQIDQTSCQRE